jgi:hypothetical protein
MKKVFLILLILLTVPLFSATTGKIVGRVYDSSTGKTLPGVNVIIEGTTMGTATNPDGANGDPRVFSPKRFMRFGITIKW